MKYAVITFGCRVNQADSLGFEEGFRASGLTAAAPEGVAWPLTAPTGQGLRLGPRVCAAAPLRPRMTAGP